MPCIEDSILFQHIEEILGYLQVCERLEATKTFLCVQQVYNCVFNHLILIRLEAYFLFQFKEISQGLLLFPLLMSSNRLGQQTSFIGWFSSLVFFALLLKKTSITSQPIRNKTKIHGNFLTHVLQQFAPAICIWFQFSMVSWIFCVNGD